MIDLLKLATLLEQMRCRPAVLSGQWDGQNFDIVAGSNKNAVLVKALKTFDDRSAREIETIYSDLCAKSSGWLLGKRFELVILAETVDVDIQPYFDWSERLRKIASRSRLYDMKSGGGRVSVVDLENKEILPRTKWFPEDGSNIGRELQKLHLDTSWGRALVECW
jgi:hypothetical protein